MFVALLILIFLCVASICFFDREKTRAVKATYAVVVAVLVLMAAFRPAKIDNDYASYVANYYGASSQVMEFTFYWITAMARSLFQDPRALFVCYALLSIPLRSIAIIRHTHLWLLSLLLWMSHFYLLQDMTQIRVAVAASFYLLAVSFLAERRRWAYLGLALCAACFHYSAFILLPLVFLGNRPLSTRWRVVLYVLPLLGYAFYVIGFNPILSVPIDFVQDKIDIYEKLQKTGIVGEGINVFNIVYMVKLCAYYFILWKYDIIAPQVKALPLLLKLFAISYFCFPTLAFMPVMAYRVTELIGAVEVVLLPYLALSVKTENNGRLLVVTYCIGLFLLNIFYNHLLIVT